MELLLLITVGVDGMEVVRNGFLPHLHIIQNHLEKKLPGRIQDRSTTSRSLQFNFDRYIEVDALVSPFWREPKMFYDFLREIPAAKRSMYVRPHEVCS